MTAPTHPEPRPDDEGRETVSENDLVGQPDAMDLYLALCNAAYMRLLADSPSLEEHESSWAIGARDVIESLVVKLLEARLQPALTPHPAPLGATDETWCVIFKRDTDPIVYLEGPPAEMLAYYERLAIQWTGVVLCKVLVPDASSAPMGEARARFDALRAALQATP